MIGQVGWYAHPAFENWAQPFEEKYQMMDVVMVGDNSFPKKMTRKQEGRHCILCNTSYPETTFKNVPHLLPRMIGNADLYSPFECDVCNSKFSLFESDLASFLGVGRSISGLKDDKKAPGFPGIGLNAKSITFNGKKLMVILKKDAERNLEDASTKLKYQKPTYTPANIYKLMLKCALSVLPQDEVMNNYQLALEHLQGGKVLCGAHINLFRFPLNIKMPLHIYIFKKKAGLQNIPTYITSFYFDNVVITFPVFLHNNDVEFLNKKIEFPIAPVYGNDIGSSVPVFTFHNLTSPFPLKNETEEIKLQHNKAEMDKAYRLDLKTGEEKQTVYNPSGSKYFIATEPDAVFSKEELKELMDLIEKRFAN